MKKKNLSFVYLTTIIFKKYIHYRYLKNSHEYHYYININILLWFISEILRTNSVVIYLSFSHIYAVYLYRTISGTTPNSQLTTLYYHVTKCNLDLNKSIII